MDRKPCNYPKLGRSEIRSIRKHLGLKQAEAGELLGCGPSSFAKYERGDVSPSVALCKLLRLVGAHPSLLDELRGGARQPMVRSQGFGPFEVTGEHVGAMQGLAFANLLQRLLTAESTAHALPRCRIQVASNLNAPDGGEDGSIEWEGGPERTRFLPCRRIVFQLKNRKVSPGEAAEEVMRGSKNDITRRPKEQVEGVLRDGGCYILLCSQSYVHNRIQQREQSILTALRESGLSVDDSQVQFRDADGIASWVNQHPAVAVWVLEQTQPGSVGLFRSWDHWKGRGEHQRTPWIDDERLLSLQARLMGEAVERGGVLHLVGLSGIGKSRLLLEAFGSGELAKVFGDLVMYADESEHDPAAIKGAVRKLADMGQRAIVIVDCCTLSTARALANMVQEDRSRLSLVTVEDRGPSDTLDPHQVPIQAAPLAVIEGIVEKLAPGIPSQDMRRLVNIAKGYPEFAISMLAAWNALRPLGHVAKDSCVTTFLQAQSHENPELIVQSARLAAVFGSIRVDEESDERLEEVARVGGLDAQELHRGIQHLADISAARRRGTLYVLEPRPVSLYLAERQWKEWTPRQRDEILAGELNPELRVSAARQLRLLNTTEVAREVVKRICRPRGPLDDPEQLSDSVCTEMLADLVDVDARCVVDFLDRTLTRFDDLSVIRGDARRNLVRTLRRAAFPEDTFDGAACLLLRLALAENETYGDNASGALAELFPLVLGGTAAGADRRLRFLREVAGSTGPKDRVVAVQALTQGIKTGHFLRMAGTESHGVRPSLDSWHPATRAEATDYLEKCARLLANVAGGDDEAGAIARYELAEGFRSLLATSLTGVDFIEALALEVREARGHWPEAISALESHLEFDAGDAAQSERIRGLIEQLRPRDLARRTLDLVSAIPDTYRPAAGLDDDAREELLRKRVMQLADELVVQPDVLGRVMPDLCSRPRAQAQWLGACLARHADSASDSLDLVKSAYLQAPAGDLNDDLLAGFLCGLRDHDPEAVERFKREAAQSAQLAATLPHVCRSLGLASADVGLVLQALEAGLLPPNKLEDWMVRGCLESVPVTEVATFFDKVLDHSAEGFFAAVGLVGSHCMSSRDKLDQFLPQVRKIAENGTNWEHPAYTETVGAYFERLMEKVLKRGREDPDAQAVAASLANRFVKSLRSRSIARRLERLLPTLLSDFAAVAWQFIGAAILSARSKVWLLEFAMQRPVGSRLERPTVMASLPEETLIAWCRAHPAIAPAFAAATLPVLATGEDGTAQPALHPTMARVIDEFWDCKGVLESLGDNMSTFTWWGSDLSRLKLYDAPLKSLRDREEAAVSRWAEGQLRYFKEWSERERSWADEQEARTDA